MKTGSLTRSALIFALIFFVANLAFDAYRAGGVTAGAFGSAVVTTLIATALYVLFLRFMSRRKDRSK